MLSFGIALRRALPLGLVLGLCACGDAEVVFPPPDAQPMVVVFTSPSHGAVMPVDSDIIAVFNDCLDERTITSDSFEVADSDGLPLEGDYNLGSALDDLADPSVYSCDPAFTSTTTVVFSPSVGLSPGSRYTVTLTEDIRGRTLGRLSATVAFEFSTQ